MWCSRGRGADELVHFEHGAADEAGDSAAARFSFAGFVAEVLDGGEDQQRSAAIMNDLRRSPAQITVSNDASNGGCIPK